MAIEQIEKTRKHYECSPALTYIWPGMHHRSIVIRHGQSGEIVGRMFGKVEQILLLNVFSLDVDELVSVRPVHLVQKPDGGGDRVGDGLSLQMRSKLTL